MISKKMQNQFPEFTQYMYVPGAARTSPFVPCIRTRALCRGYKEWKSNTELRVRIKAKHVRSILAIQAGRIIDALIIKIKDRMMHRLFSPSSMMHRLSAPPHHRCIDYVAPASIMMIRLLGPRNTNASIIEPPHQ